MRLEELVSLARIGRLYPSVILHGADDAARREAGLELARALLCEERPEERPCGVCRHCRRIAWSGGEPGASRFHPDFHLLERDLKTATSVEATRLMLQQAQVSPFEARGQVFIIASAESLSGGAANALLKALEEPGVRAPRNYLLLAPSQYDLLPTLRSRSLAVYLGASSPPDQDRTEELAVAFTRACLAFRESHEPGLLLAAAAALEGAGGWEDPRAGAPWALAAAAVLRSLDKADWEESTRGGLLALAADLLEGPVMRVRAVRPQRVLEGLVARRLQQAMEGIAL